jgi:hypothetical protein
MSQSRVVHLLKPVRGLSQVPKQKKKKNWDNFLGANIQVCHPKGPFLNLGRPWTSPSRVFKEARPLRVFKEVRPDFVPFGTECGKKKI